MTMRKYVYMIPRHGNEIIQTEPFTPTVTRLIPWAQKEMPMLNGKLYLGDASAPAGQEIVDVPAGLRKELRSVFSPRNKVVVQCEVLAISVPRGTLQPAWWGCRPGAGWPDFLLRLRVIPYHWGRQQRDLACFWGPDPVHFFKGNRPGSLWSLKLQELATAHGSR